MKPLQSLMKSLFLREHGVGVMAEGFSFTLKSRLEAIGETQALALIPLWELTFRSPLIPFSGDEHLIEWMNGLVADDNSQIAVSLDWLRNMPGVNIPTSNFTQGSIEVGDIVLRNAKVTRIVSKGLNYIIDAHGANSGHMSQARQLYMFLVDQPSLVHEPLGIRSNLFTLREYVA